MTEAEDIQRTVGKPSPENNFSAWTVVVCIVIGLVVMVLAKNGWRI